MAVGGPSSAIASSSSRAVSPLDTARDHRDTTTSSIYTTQASQEQPAAALTPTQHSASSSSASSDRPRSADDDGHDGAAAADLASSSKNPSKMTNSSNTSDSGSGDKEAEEKPGYTYNPGTRRKEEVITRQHIYQFWKPKHAPPPPPLTMEEASDSPLLKAGIISKLSYQWATPIMVLGWKRALEATDLNKLAPERESLRTSELLLQDWEIRVREADEYNRKLAAGEIPVGSKRKMKWSISRRWNAVTGRGDGSSFAEREAKWRSPPPPGAWAPPVGKGKSKSSAKPPPKKIVNPSGYKRPSLILSLHSQMAWLLWTGVIYKALGDISQVTSPLVLRQIINFGAEQYAAHIDPTIPAPPIGHGIGWAFLLFFMQWFASIFQHQFFFRTMSVGVYSRSALVAAIFRRSTRMNSKDRSPGKLLNHCSTDVSRIDFASAWAPLIFTTPLQLGICLGLLIWQIGPAALAGFGLLFLSMPIQGTMMKSMFGARAKSMVFTDQRSKLINELLNGMRIVKSFAYENEFLKRMASIRRKELQGIRKLLILRSVNQALSFSLPTLAAVVSFIIYKAVGNTLNPADIFTALTLFQLLRLPLMFLPMSLSSGTDAYNAFLRLQTVFEAEQMKDLAEYDESSKSSLQIIDATFQWAEVVAPSGTAAAGMGQTKGQAKKALKEKKALDKKNGITAGEQAQAEKSAGVAGDQSEATATQEIQNAPKQLEVNLKEGETATPTVKQEPFALRNLDLVIPQGQLCAIVGPVGSGKSSLLSACLGEMPNKGGQVIWNTHSVGYVPQSAWIQAASLRDNILFGQPFKAERYWRCVKLAELEGDLAALPQADFTGIGERGITLSGGQKQRVSIARALYFDPDIFLFDDILSALDAHVGKAIFHNAILDLKARGKTVVLVTHALHHLHGVDRIITLDEGRIAESGTYDELRDRQDGAFSRLMAEFGGQEEEEEEEKIEDEEEGIESSKHRKKDLPAAAISANAAGDAKNKKDGGAGIMSIENRNTGSVSGKVYKKYFKAGKGQIMLPLIAFFVILMQGATVMNSYWLVFWQEGQFGDANTKDGLYMGVYAALGVAQAILTFATGFVTSMLSFYACANLHNDAMTGIMFAKMSFFDLTPIGRLMNLFTKDIDVADNQLADSFRMALNTIGTVLGSVILITVLTHYFVAIVAVILIGYYFGALFYRSSARELKRLDAILRSSLYAHLSESLTGLVVVRAYGETKTFIQENMRRNDHENRAYFMTIVNQRWLGVRLDFLGALLTLLVAILVVAASSLAPGKVGVALSYVVSTSQAFSWMTRQIAEVENNMNSVERLSYYTDSIDQEAAQDIPNKVSPSWPEKGEIVISNMALRYRPELPLVLKDVSLTVRPGEKVGIVGRTGAGKSSLLTGLLRLVELEAGSVVIDGVDIAKIGIADLRRKVAVLPQDPLIFSGTLRSNLDPFGEWDDARLNDALRRAYLVTDDPRPSSSAAAAITEKQAPIDGPSTPHHQSNTQRFTLDTIIEEEGANLSLGQRSLVSLARALVKDSQIILLDEATASVDVATDARIQETIRHEFKNRTLLCIAHRLRTIIAYDRIAVFDKGKVMEYASPLELYERPDGIFRDMCLKASITREEMIKAKELNV